MTPLDRAQLPHGRMQRGANIALLALAGSCIAWAFLARRFWFVTDDAFISFRYARNWAEGHGLRYNLGAGPPVEGFSNFSWTALMAGIHRLGGDMVAAAPWISASLALVLIVLVYRFLRRIHGEDPGGAGAAAAGAAFMALFPPFAVWSTGGLETALFALLLFVAYERLLGRPEGPRPVQGGTAAALLALTRPEGIAFALGIAGLYGLGRLSRGKRVLDRPAVVYLGVVAAVAALFLGLRIATFGKLLPNTAYAKMELSPEVVLRGLFYVLHFCLTFVTPALLLAALPWLLARARGSPPRVQPRLHAAAMIGASVAFCVASGGDFMAMGRFLAPATPFLAILAAAAFFELRAGCGRHGHGLTRFYAETTRRTLLGAALVAQILPAFNQDLMPEGMRRALHFRWRNPHDVRTEYEQWRYMCENTALWTAGGKTLGRYARPGESLVCLNIGAFGYYSGLYIHDEGGLVDPRVATRRTDPDRGPASAGHDKLLPPELFLDYFLPLRPTFLQARVLRGHEVASFIGQMVAGGIPPGYRIMRIPIDTGSRPGPLLTLVLLERQDRR